MWDNDVYYNPEKFGLNKVAEIDFSDGCYQFDLLVVWRDTKGGWFYAEDSGCSCPSPFDSMGLPDLTRVQGPEEIISRMEYRLKNSYCGDVDAGIEPYGKDDVEAFKSKVRLGDFR